MVVPYTNTIIINKCQLIINIIIKFHTYTKNIKVSYHVKLFYALHGLATSINFIFS